MEQEAWLLHKKSVFESLGFNCRLYTYECTNGRSDKIHRTVRFYTQNTQELRRLQDQWYELVEGKRRKKIDDMIQYAPFDEESFAIWFLDNGCAAMKKRCIDYRYGTKFDVEPFLDRFVLSTPYRDMSKAIQILSSWRIEAINPQANTLKSHIAIGKKESKMRVILILKNFCEKNKIEHVFSYKYNQPISLSHVERLNEKASKCISWRGRLQEDDAKVWTRLITERESGMSRGRSEEVSPPISEGDRS